MINKQVQTAFERNQKDLTLPNVTIIWAGNFILVFLPASPELREPDEAFKADSKAVSKIKAFCVANDARCSQIKGDIIHL